MIEVPIWLNIKKTDIWVTTYMNTSTKNPSKVFGSEQSACSGKTLLRGELDEKI